MSAYLDNDFLRGYLECALWLGTDESDDSGGRPLDENYTIAEDNYQRTWDGAPDKGSRGFASYYRPYRDACTCDEGGI